MLAAWKKSYHKPRQYIKKQSHHFADKCLYIQSYGFSCSHVRLWELDYKESWALKNWCFRTVVMAKTLESPLDSKEIKPVNPKGNQPWLFIGRIDAKTKAPIVCPAEVNNQLTGKDPDAGKDWAEVEKDEIRWWWGWDGWMASQTRWTWVWTSSGSWWWTGKPGVLQSMGSQRVRHDSANELNVSLVAQTVKNLPAMWETQVWYLGQEDPLEKGMATYSSILAWRIPLPEEPGGLCPWGHEESDKTDWLILSLFQRGAKAENMGEVLSQEGPIGSCSVTVWYEVWDASSTVQLTCLPDCRLHNVEIWP